MAAGDLTVFVLFCASYLDDFLRQSGLQPLQMLPVRDEQLKHVTGHLSHSFVPKLYTQKGQDLINNVKNTAYCY